MILRGLLLLLPLSIWAVLFYRQALSTRQLTATLMGFVLAFPLLLIVNLVALKVGAWSFGTEDTLFYGVPLDWILGQSIVFGALLPLTRELGCSRGLRLTAQVLLLVGIYCASDLRWPDFPLALLLFPGLFAAAGLAGFLADWTATDTRVSARSALQSLAWAALLFWLFPAAVFQVTGDDWSGLLQRDLTHNALWLVPMLLPAYLIGDALYQFAVVGQGTAFPFDPPRRLVTTGVYARISNPMQLGICLAMGWWGVILQSDWIVGSALVAVALFIVFKNVCNGSCAIGVGNQDWVAYQATVPKWLPRLRMPTASGRRRNGQASSSPG